MLLTKLITGTGTSTRSSFIVLKGRVQSGTKFTSRMSGESNLSLLLKSMKPVLYDKEYVFYTTTNLEQNSYIAYDPIATFREEEGLTLILERQNADAANFSYSTIFRMITLSVHSSLDAVGFLAAITTKLATAGISCNPVSAFYHDHLFVPASRADEALALLKEFSNDD